MTREEIQVRIDELLAAGTLNFEEWQELMKLTLLSRDLRE